MESYMKMVAIKNAANENKSFEVESLTFKDDCVVKHGRFLGKVRVLPHMALMAVVGDDGKMHDIPLNMLTDESIDRLYEQSEVYGEVKCDYLNEEDGWWCIDAWKSADDDEEGEVVGFVDAQSGNIYYKHEKAMSSRMVTEVAEAKQAEVRKENKQRQGQLGETIAMLTAQVWDKVYPEMREPDCTALSCAIRDAAYKFEEEWNDKPFEERDGYYIDMIDQFAERLIKELRDLYC